MNVWIGALIFSFFIACRPATTKRTLFRAGLSNRMVIVVCVFVTVLLYSHRFA